MYSFTVSLKLLLSTPPCLNTSFKFWQSCLYLLFLFSPWPGTGMCASSHMTVCCRSLLSLSCGTNINQRLLTWLYMNDTVSRPSPPHCSASNPGCALSPESSVTCEEFAFRCMRMCTRLETLRRRGGAAVPVPVGGDQRGLSGLLRQTRTNLVVAGWCLLIHTEGWSCAHCKCSGLCMFVYLERCC